MYPLELRKPTAELPKPISHDPSTKVLETQNGIDKSKHIAMISEIQIVLMHSVTNKKPTTHLHFRYCEKSGLLHNQ